MTRSEQPSAPFFLHAQDTSFPDPALALHDPNGLLAIGGDLSPQRLLAAYRLGIFPWFSHDQPILWWAPDPRVVLYPGHLRINRSLHKTLNKGLYRITFDQAFARVVSECAGPRRGAEGTWITPEMQRAYQRLHALGHAHSVEVWQGDELVGGLYGVTVGAVFCGESMFSHQSDASKVALVTLAGELQSRGYLAIDCQMYTHHLATLGAEEIPRARFMALLQHPAPAMPWPGTPA
ncbi:MAG: leucyl/phenylalanyl-tRNA--protein transferase [Gammaproteobacteria bacterium RBG_16_57_12]|nr:MAG: leucyl/phenylalanyl-tRNA--protein transferase [Gammaproteobacteria bacterium RBG_16_57_12]